MGTLLKWQEASFTFADKLIAFEFMNLGRDGGDEVQIGIKTDSELVKKVLRCREGLLVLRLLPKQPIANQEIEWETFSQEQKEFLTCLHDAVQWTCFGYISS